MLTMRIPTARRVATDVWRAHHPTFSPVGVSTTSGSSTIVPSVTARRLAAV